MYSFNLEDVRLNDVPMPNGSIRAEFPLQSANGTGSFAAVLFEVDPGEALATHTDSAEEALLVLAGEGEAWVGSETGSSPRRRRGRRPGDGPARRPQHGRDGAARDRLLLELDGHVDLRARDRARRGAGHRLGRRSADLRLARTDGSRSLSIACRRPAIAWAAGTSPHSSGGWRCLASRHGAPNHVVSASGSPGSVPSPTQATYPSGLTSTAAGAATSPRAGSSHSPA